MSTIHFYIILKLLGDDRAKGWYTLIEKKRKNYKGVEFYFDINGLYVGKNYSFNGIGLKELYNSYWYHGKFYQPILVGKWGCKEVESNAKK